MASLYLLSEPILANLGIVGFYVGKTFDESKKRPLYILETVVK
jgi:dolichol-phosphate mannosyltransferase